MILSLKFFSFHMLQFCIGATAMRTGWLLKFSTEQTAQWVPIFLASPTHPDPTRQISLHFVSSF